MNESEYMFTQIVKGLPNGIEGKMFGAKCIKSTNGKTAAFIWQEQMVFKLDEKTEEEALNLTGSKAGSHIYAPDKPMKGWVSIPKLHLDKWLHFAEKALDHVEALKK
jgi:hypothetical protein